MAAGEVVADKLPATPSRTSTSRARPAGRARRHLGGGDRPSRRRLIRRCRRSSGCWRRSVPSVLGRAGPGRGWPSGSAPTAPAPSPRTRSPPCWVGSARAVHGRDDGGMPGITRGFFGRRRAERDPRLPPGQYDARDDWPVLHAEATPADRHRPLDVHRRGARRAGGELDLGARSTRCPRSRYSGDIHCVTTWSKLGMTFDGVSVDTLLDAAGPLPSATHVLAVSHTGYTTNLPLADVTGGKAWVVWDADGRPLTVEHGGPARLLVPHLYFWKSAEVGLRAAPARPRRAGVLGAQRLPRPRRPLERAALPGRLSDRYARAAPPTAQTLRWQTARVLAVRDETPRARTLRLALPAPRRAPRRPALRAAADRARRLHGVPLVLGRLRARTTPAEIELTVERLDDGEVSEFLHDVVVPGDELEVRGPIGGFFAWAGRHPGAAGRRRLRGGAADGDAAAGPADRPRRPAPAGGVGPLARRPLLRRRAARTADHGALHPAGAAGDATAGRAAGRRRRGPAGPRRRGGLRLRLGRLRRRGDRGAAGGRGAGRSGSGWSGSARRAEPGACGADHRHRSRGRRPAGQGVRPTAQAPARWPGRSGPPPRSRR